MLRPTNHFDLSRMMRIHVIAAVDKEFNIGRDNELPWGAPLRRDMMHFRNITRHGENPAILMGRNTWESLPKRPLPGVRNIVLSSRYDPPFNHLQDTLEYLESEVGVSDLVCIGGAQLYEDLFNTVRVDSCWLTHIDAVFQGCDTKFPYEAFLAQGMVEQKVLPEHSNLVHDNKFSDHGGLFYTIKYYA